MTDLSSERALELLRRLTHPDADFRTGQSTVIAALCKPSARVILSQPPNWGKLTTALVAGRILRDSRQGPVIYVTSLITGMNHAVSSARRLGLSAETLNSSNADEWMDLIERAQADRTDFLAVSPARLLNARFMTEVMQAVAKTPSLIVFEDAESGCVLSPDWQPEYSRAVQASAQVFSAHRLLFLTSVASQSVIADLSQQNGIRLEDVFAGDLFRRDIRFQHLPLPRDEEKLAFIADRLKRISGVSLVCAGTAERCDSIVDWLRANGVAAAAFHGYSDDRDQVHEGLLNARLHCVVSTMTLSAGLRLPRLSGLFHFDPPNDLSQYYKQLGMLASVGGMTGWAFMLCSADDLSRASADRFFGSTTTVHSVLSLLEHSPEPMSAEAIGATLNIDTWTVMRTLRMLQLENPPLISRRVAGYHRTLNPVTASFEHKCSVISKTHCDSARDLATFLSLSADHLQFMIRSLAPHATEFRSALKAHQPASSDIEPDLQAAAEKHFDSRRFRFEPRKRWPSVDLPSGRTGFIPFSEQPSAGTAFCNWMLGRNGRRVAAEITRGILSASTIDSVASFLRENVPEGKRVAWITVVPSRRNSGLLSDLARALSERMNIPYEESLRFRRSARPRLNQRDIRSSPLLALNVDQAFDVRSDFTLRRDAVLLVDDWVSSRWTMTMASAELRSAGVPCVVPFALAYRSSD